jgi:hypothetical protein
MQIRCAISSRNCFPFPVASAIIFVPEHIRVYMYYVVRQWSTKKTRVFEQSEIIEPMSLGQAD